MHRNRTSLSVTPLEGREVPACIVTHPTPHTVVITGNAANDVVKINDNGAGTISGSATGAGAFSFTGIKNVLVATGDGADVVMYSLVGNLQLGQERVVGVWLGRGNDTFSAGLCHPNGVGSDLKALSSLQLHAYGGDGKDFLYVNAARDVDVAVGAELKLNLRGEAGNDHIRATYYGENDGTVAFQSFDGGAGRDVLYGQIAEEGGSTGTTSALLSGGDDRDHLRLNMFTRTPPSLAVIDGGAGSDLAFGTPNVTKINIP